MPDFNRIREVPIDPQRGTILRAGIATILNPFDNHAIEEALRLREIHGGRVTAISMGPCQARSVLRDALVMGADAAVLLSDPAFAGADTLATSLVLAEACRRLAPFSLVICGQETADGATSHIAPSLAEWLDLPQATLVRRVDINGSKLRAQCRTTLGFQEIEGALPMVLSVTRDINRPRHLRLRAVAAAAAKEIPTWSRVDLGLREEEVGLSGSPTRVPRIFRPRLDREGEIISGPPAEAVDALVRKLGDLRMI